jgi:hypothetical protein
MLWLDPEIILPEQMYVPGAVSGEVKMLAACMEGALRSYLLYSKYPSAPGAAAVVNEVELWLDSEEAEYPFAFRTICEALGTSHTAIRLIVRKMRDEKRLLPRKGRPFSPAPKGRIVLRQSHHRRAVVNS